MWFTTSWGNSPTLVKLTWSWSKPSLKGGRDQGLTIGTKSKKEIEKENKGESPIEKNMKIFIIERFEGDGESEEVPPKVEGVVMEIVVIDERR